MESSPAWPGPERRLPERLAGFPELSVHIVDMFLAGDKICYASRLAGTRACPYRCRGGRPAGDRCGLCCWCFDGGKVAEIPTIQDRFPPLKRISCLPRRDLCGGGRASWRAGSPENRRRGPHLHRKPYTGFRLCLPPGPASRGCLAMTAVGGNELLTSFPAEIPFQPEKTLRFGSASRKRDARAPGKAAMLLRTP